MSTLSDFNARVEEIIQDDAGILQTGEIDNFIAEAVKRYSHHRPLLKVHEVQGNGEYDYDLPSDWSPGFSTITQVEYPAGQQVPSIIPKEAWTFVLKLVDSTQTWKLRFLTLSPSPGNLIRLIYTLPHTVDSESSTVFENDFDAVCNLAASYCCGALSRKYAQTSEPTLGADVVNYSAKSSTYAARAKELFQSYLDQLGLSEVDASGGIKEFDTGFIWGEEYLTHKSWQR